MMSLMDADDPFDGEDPDAVAHQIIQRLRGDPAQQRMWAEIAERTARSKKKKALMSSISTMRTGRNGCPSIICWTGGRLRGVGSSTVTRARSRIEQRAGLGFPTIPARASARDNFHAEVYDGDHRWISAASWLPEPMIRKDPSCVLSVRGS